MKRFSQLLDRLVYTKGRNAKITLLSDYFATTPDPDRGWALAALTGGWEKRLVTPAMVRKMVEERTDPELFRLSYDYVGDLAETVALIWPEAQEKVVAPSLAKVVQELELLKRDQVPVAIEHWLNGLDAVGRYGLLKFLMGGMRVGVSARLAKTALAQYGGVAVEQIEELWFGLTPPYRELFQWLDGKSGPPDVDLGLAYRPVMLAHPLDDQDLAKLDPSQFAAEWKWDGIRVQLVLRGSEKRLYSRMGEDISGSFPDVLDHTNGEGVLDGELLVMRDGEVAPFGDLQQRLNRKRVTRNMLKEFPAHIRCYDILFAGETDMRQESTATRRIKLAAWLEQNRSSRLDLSDLVKFDSWDTLAELREGARESGNEGLMLKKLASPYLSGRPKGHWYKWKRDPLMCDCVLMYAQRGHGKRSSYYSDFTFGCWREGDEGPELVPVGKAYSGFTDVELGQLDKWVRTHTVDRFGPVRALAQELVVEVAFDAVQRSTRHKSGVAMRFPRFHRIRWDKPAADAEQLEGLLRLLEKQPDREKVTIAS